ncbi:MAG: NUDIX hydrolase [bacterium]|nr:NUDIX hydrolase [Deltaproteobacteria bacterium]MCP4903435.1 NUDIX hydrolase [bacterium]
MSDPTPPATAQPVAARPASTILLLRDGPQMLEVFMVERHHKIDFAEGALVFPGGKTEKSDGEPALAGHCRLANGADAAALSRDELAVRVGAIRETFEECGVLLARRAGEATLVDAALLGVIAERHREALHEDRMTMLEFVRSEELELAFDLLVPFAHWITPEFMPKRFDTHFFLVDAPGDQLAVHDGIESVDSLWTTIPNALHLEETGRRNIIFPTLENIKKLGRSRSVVQALERARARPVVTVLPRLTKDAQGALMMELPEEAGYDTVRAPIAALGGGLPKSARAPT